MASMRIASIVGLVGLVIAFVLDVDRALLAYLSAYVTVASIAIGGLVLLLIGYVTNARWLAPLRRLQEGLAIVFPLLAVLFVPIAIGVHRIYVWAGPLTKYSEHERHLIEAKQAWLDPTGFIVRSAIYLAVFIVATEVLRRRRSRAFAAAMLPAVGLALTFASIDWLMSLQPEWISTMFGVYFFAAGFSAGIAVLAISAARARAAIGLTGHHFHALGRMLFGFAVFWTYTSYFQGFLIQIANRPNEVTFYIARTEGGWQYVLAAVVATRFVLPFFLLLPRSVKFRPRYVAAIAAIVVAGHALDIAWLTLPANGASLSWMDLAALLAIGGACMAFASWRQRHTGVVPVDDPFLAPGLHYESPT